MVTSFCYQLERVFYCRYFENWWTLWGIWKIYKVRQCSDIDGVCDAFVAFGL